MIEEKVVISKQNPAKKKPAPLEMAAWLGLILATLGLALALKLLTRLWQSLTAFFSLDFSLTGIESRSNPFQNFDSPFPLFPVMMLVLWVICAAYLVRKISGFSLPLVDNKRFPVFKVVMAVLAIVAIVEVGLLVRSAQLLPTTDGRLPASNFDEMVYFSAANLWANGYTPYKDFFLAHPPLTVGIFALFFKLLGYSGGGYEAFLAVRWLSVMLSLLTCAGIWWCAGRMWAAGWGYRWLIGAVCGLVYAFDVRVGQIAVLETVSNLFAVVAFACFILAQEKIASTGSYSLYGIAGCGVFTGLATLAKLPAGALLFAFVVYFALKTQWKALLWVMLGFVATFGVILGGVALFAGVGEPLRQMLFYQLLRPQEVREGLDQIARIADYPETGLTIFLAGAALFALVWRLWRAKLLNDWWLIPLLWSIPTLLVITAGKTFHPWYYVQWALPLALLTGALIPTKGGKTNPAQTSSTGLAFNLGKVKVLPLAGLILLLVVCLPLISRQWQAGQSVEYDAVYRPVGTVVQANSPSNLLTFDPGYSLMGKTVPARMATGKILLDSAGYMVYLNLEIDRRGWFDLIGAGLNSSRERGLVEATFRRDRAQAAVLTAVTGGQWAALDGKIALPQLTPRSVEYIAGAGDKSRKIGYVELYPVLPNPVVREYRFDNGLICKPMGLSSSFEGKANFDALAPDGSLRLKAGEVATRTLDLRLLWWLNSSRLNPPPAKVFIHVLNEKGEKVAQRDILPLDDTSNTQAWKAGDFYQDVHSLPLPSNLIPGRYQVVMGLYHPETLQPVLVEGRGFIWLGNLIIV